MGNCNNTRDLNVGEIKLPNKCDYEFQYVIGRGGFGRVWRAENKKTKTQYAIKEMQKCKYWFISCFKQNYSQKKYWFSHEREILQVQQYTTIILSY